MKRTSVNPVMWGQAYHMDQGEIVEGATRHLRVSGQVSLVEDINSELGLSVADPRDLRAQLKIALANIDAILKKAGMERSNLVFIRFYTTSVRELRRNYDVYAEWITEADIRPPQSLIGVKNLVMPGLLIEVEAEAVD